MRWRQNQYLLFSKCVAKINRIEEYITITAEKGEPVEEVIDTRIKLRKFSKGTTKDGYSYQQYMTLEHLDKMFQDSKVRIISPEEVMRILLANFEGCMPIIDMEMT